MTSKISPERARDLLNMAHQGAQDGQRPVTVAAKYAPLAEAAYALAQTVAGLRYEYAVQVKRPVWKYESVSGGWTIFPEHAQWLLDVDEAESAAKLWGKRYDTRVVSRLTSTPEVVE